MKIVFLTVLLAMNVKAEVKEFDLAGGKLNVKNGSGHIKIQAHSESKVKVEYHQIAWGKDCNLMLKQASDEVKIKVENHSSSILSHQQCQVDLVISIPKDFSGTLESGSGEISIDGMKGDLKFKTGSGNVAISNAIITKMEGRSGSGDISLKGEFLQVELKTGSGKISTLFEKMASKAKFKAKTGSGSVFVAVPTKATVKTNFKSGSGQMSVKASYNPNPNLEIEVKTGSGDLKVEQL